MVSYHNPVISETIHIDNDLAALQEEKRLVFFPILRYFVLFQVFSCLRLVTDNKTCCFKPCYLRDHTKDEMTRVHPESAAKTVVIENNLALDLKSDAGPSLSNGYL